MLFTYSNRILINNRFVWFLAKILKRAAIIIFIGFQFESSFFALFTSHLARVWLGGIASKGSITVSIINNCNYQQREIHLYSATDICCASPSGEIALQQHLRLSFWNLRVFRESGRVFSNLFGEEHFAPRWLFLFCSLECFLKGSFILYPREGCL